MPVTPVLDRGLSGVGGPHHHVRGARLDLVIAPRAPVGLERPRGRDRLDVVVVSVWPGLDAARRRQWRQRPLPAGWRAAPDHPIILRPQNKRNSSLSMPRI